jgi:flagellar protein FliO/FliZ
MRAICLLPQSAVSVALAGIAAAAGAADAPAAGAANPPSLTAMVLGLLVVVAMIPAAAWLLRRSGFTRQQPTAGLRVVAQLPLGPRERLVIVDAGERRWVLGVSPAGIARLGTLAAGSMPDPTPPAPAAGRFADVLKRFTLTR